MRMNVDQRKSPDATQVLQRFATESIVDVDEGIKKNGGIPYRHWATT